MKDLDTNDEFISFTKDNKLALVDFSATWCGPCKQLTPKVEELSQEMTNISFGKVDIEILASVAEEFNIEGVPTLVLFKDGKEVDRQVGAIGKTALKTWLTKLST